MYCEKCRRAFVETESGRCPACGSKHIRDPLPEDICYLTETDPLFGGMLKDVLERHDGRCFIQDDKLGEDLAFCLRANRCGYQIWCDPTVRIGHVGHIVIWPEDGDRMRGDIQGLEGKKVE